MSKQTKKPTAEQYNKSPPKFSGACATMLLAYCTAATAQSTEDNAELIPNLELLEFLGSFETDNGDWIAPDSLLTDDFQELLNMAARMDEVSGNTGNATSNQDADSNDSNTQQDN